MAESRKQIVPYGSWPSPLSAARVTAGGVAPRSDSARRRRCVLARGAGVGGRPQCDRQAIAVGRDHRRDAAGLQRPLARARIRRRRLRRASRHGLLFELRRSAHLSAGRGRHAAADHAPRAPCYADFRVDVPRSRLIGVREHDGRERDRRDCPATCSSRARTSIRIRSSVPTGKFLAWLEWNHPNMPWDGTELWVAVINPDGSIGSREKIAGGARRIDLPAGVVAGWRAVLRIGSHRLVESLSMERDFVRAVGAASIRWRRSSASRSGRSAW